MGINLALYWSLAACNLCISKGPPSFSSQRGSDVHNYLSFRKPSLLTTCHPADDGTPLAHWVTYGTNGNVVLVHSHPQDQYNA